MIKRILIPLDPSPYTDAAIEAGCMYAKDHDAEVTGMVILDVPGIEHSIGAIPAGGMYYAEKLEKYREKEASDRIHSLLAKFKERCEKAGIRHREAEYQGTPSEQIINHSIFYDVIFMGLRTFFHFETRDKPGDTLDKVLKHSITPVLGLPKKPHLHGYPKKNARILIAYDGSYLATRTLQRFIHLAPHNEIEVKLVISHSKESTAHYYLKEAQNYLIASGIQTVTKEWTTQKIIEAMKDQYLDWADIVVVGAHSKKGIFDFMVGSLTKYLIKESKTPVFIGQ